MRYVKGFDTLRAIGTICVVIDHSGELFDKAVPGGNFIKDILLPDGRLCVYLFFVLSGYLITSILLSAKTAGKGCNSLQVLKNFFIRRGLKIYPVYYLLLFALFCLNFPDVRANILYFATYTSNILIYRTYTWNAFCVTWTLSIEEQFYLLWPFIILFVKDRYIIWILGAAVLVGIISTYFTVGVQCHIAPCLVYNCFDAFGIGGIYACVNQKGRGLAIFEKMMKLLGCCALAIYCYWKISFYLHHPLPFSFLEKTIDCIIAMWLIILVVNNKSAWLKTNLLENRVLNFIGKMSYCIYLVHDVYLNKFLDAGNKFINIKTAAYPMLNTTLLNPHYNYWLHIAIIFAISFIFYKLVEQPFLELKRFFVYDNSEVKTCQQFSAD